MLLTIGKIHPISVCYNCHIRRNVVWYIMFPTDVLHHTTLHAFWHDIFEPFRLYHLNGSQIIDESEIEAGGYYVAAAREKFGKVGYGNPEATLSPRGKNGT